MEKQDFDFESYDFGQLLESIYMSNCGALDALKIKDYRALKVFLERQKDAISKLAKLPNNPIV